MAGSTFNPKPRKPRKPAKDKLPPVPAAPVEKDTKKSDSKRGRVKMIDKISVSWEPDWDEVLHELRITRT